MAPPVEDPKEASSPSSRVSHTPLQSRRMVCQEIACIFWTDGLSSSSEAVFAIKR